MLQQLIKEQIDTNATLRKQMVSALLLGGQHPRARRAGPWAASFKTVPTCQYVAQTHCVVAYSSFLKEPPEPVSVRTGRTVRCLPPIPEEIAKNLEVACVNPAAIFQQGNPSGPLFRYESTSPFPGLLGTIRERRRKQPRLGWPCRPQYSGQCQRANGATWLQLTPERILRSDGKRSKKSSVRCGEPTSRT